MCLYNKERSHLLFLCVVKGDLRSWLLDDNCYDQASVLYSQGSQVAIAHCTPQELKIVQEREVRVGSLWMC